VTHPEGDLSNPSSETLDCHFVRFLQHKQLQDVDLWAMEIHKRA
jgi:hypothetical protein